MKTTIPLGRWFGTPVGMNWSVLLTIAFVAQAMALSALPSAVPGQSTGLYWGAGTGIAVVFLLGLLAHELAHAVVARRRGVRVERITLWLLGGATVIGDQAPDARTELRIAAAGPLTSLAVGGLFVFGTVIADHVGAFPMLTASLSWLGIANLLLAAFNLLPAAPLDGGRVLHALLWRRGGDRRRASTTVGTAGRLLGVLLLALGLVEILFGGLLAGLWLTLVGWYLIAAATAESSTAVLREQLTGLTVRDVMSEPTVAPAWLTVDAFLERIARHASRRAFPVVDFNGRPCGVVSLRDLASLTADARMNTRVADAGRPLARTKVVGPDAPLLDVLTAGRIRSDDLILVVEDGLLVGVVTDVDVARTVELAALRHRPAAPH